MSEDRILNIYLAIRSSLARSVLRIVPPREVEDIVQETYVRVCQIEKNGRSIEEPRAFIYKTARNLALDHVKRAEHRLTTNLDEGSEPSALEWEQLADETYTDLSYDQTYDSAASHEEFSLFCKAVRHLPLQCRRVFVLKKVYGHSQREIAKQLNISENTVEKHVATGIKRCTYFMQQHTQSRNQLKSDQTTTYRGSGPRKTDDIKDVVQQASHAGGKRDE